MNSQRIRNVVFHADGLRYSFAMAELALDRLNSSLEEIARRRNLGEAAEELVTSALLDAWSIVDMSHRARELVSQFPGVPQKTPGIQIFIRRTAAVEELRNYVQHFRTEIPRIPATWTPLWGALAWIPASEPNACYTIFSGNPVEGLISDSITFDTHTLQFTARIVLRTGVASVDLLMLVEEMRRVRECLIHWLEGQAAFRHEASDTVIFKTVVELRL